MAPNSLIAIGRLLIALGGALLLAGGFFLLLGRSGINLSRFPGAVRIELGNTTCVAFLGLSIFLSVLLTLILNIVSKYLNR
jgi:hypothetical protein